jgi:hypothetical protein
MRFSTREFVLAVEHAVVVVTVDSFYCYGRNNIFTETQEYLEPVAKLKFCTGSAVSQAKAL